MWDGQQAATLPANGFAVPAPDPPRENAPGTPTIDPTYITLQLNLFEADPAVRRDAIRKLAELGGDPHAVELLVSAVADSNEFVRMEAVEAIGQLSNKNVADGDHHDVLADALQDSRAIVREAAVEALRHIGGQDAASALARALSDPDVSVREEAVYALAHIGGPVSTRLLEQALADPDMMIRQVAEQALVGMTR